MTEKLNRIFEFFIKITLIGRALVNGHIYNDCVDRGDNAIQCDNNVRILYKL